MKYIYEFIGTFFLVFTVGMTVVQPTEVAAMAPLAIGSVLAVMIFAGGHISGAHYNPAVSLAIFIRGRLTSKDLIKYWVFQFAGGLIAASLTMYLKDFPQQTPLTLAAGKAFLVEFLFTFALAFVVLNVATAKETKGNSFFGFAIGFTVLVGAYAVGGISGGAFNPAVALGLSVMHLVEWSDLWIFMTANLLGGGFAALVYNRARQERESKQEALKDALEKA